MMLTHKILQLTFFLLHSKSFSSKESSALIYILLQVLYLHFQQLRRSYLRTVIAYAWDMVSNGPPSPYCKSEVKITRMKTLHRCLRKSILYQCKDPNVKISFVCLRKRLEFRKKQHEPQEIKLNHKSSRILHFIINSMESYYEVNEQRNDMIQFRYWKVTLTSLWQRFLGQVVQAKAGRSIRKLLKQCR